MYPLAFPASLTPTSFKPPHLENQSRGGGTTGTGAEKFVTAPGGGRWTFSPTFAIRTREQVLDYRAFVLGMNGRVGTAIVPCFDGKRAPWATDPLTGGLITPAKAAASAATDPAFGANPDTSGACAFALVAGAPLNATSLSVTRIAGGLVRPGMLFSLGQELHVITDMANSDTGGSTAMTVSVRPWLRAAYPAGTAVEFARPLCRMRFKADDTGLTDFELLRFAQPTLEFVEDF